MKKKKGFKLFVLGAIFLVLASLVSAHGSGNESFDVAKDLINSKISCDKLSDEQLESIGDYYMEQMHSGKAHERMDAMMGGEGSSQLKQMHIAMAKSQYCGDKTVVVGSDMMNGMMSGDSSGSDSDSMHKNNRGGSSRLEHHKMMGSFGFVGMSLFWIISVALTTFIVGIVFWWTKNLMTRKNQ